MKVKLLGVPASHPCAAVAAMLEAKRVRYDRVDLVPALSRAWLRLSGYPAGTVPALRLDGARIQGSRAIARALDQAWPDPPLYPADPAARARVEEIEAWGDGPLQEVARRIFLWAMVRGRVDAEPLLRGARLQFGLPPAVGALLARPVLRADAALNGAREERVLADLAALPAMLDRIDGWIAAGELATEPPSAADYQVAGSLRLLLTMDDLAPPLADRPGGALARRLIPGYPGRVPAGVLPAGTVGPATPR